MKLLTSLPRLIVERFALEQGKVECSATAVDYANSFAPIEFLS